MKKNKEKPNLLIAAKALKLGDMFFYRKRAKNPIIYRYISMLGKGDLIIGYYQYIQKVNILEKKFLYYYVKIKKKKQLIMLYKGKKKEMYNLYNCFRAIKSQRIPSEKMIKSISKHIKNMKNFIEN